MGGAKKKGPKKGAKVSKILAAVAEELSNEGGGKTPSEPSPVRTQSGRIVKTPSRSPLATPKGRKSPRRKIDVTESQDSKSPGQSGPLKKRKVRLFEKAAAEDVDECGKYMLYFVHKSVWRKHHFTERVVFENTVFSYSRCTIFPYMSQQDR